MKKYTKTLKKDTSNIKKIQNINKKYKRYEKTTNKKWLKIYRDKKKQKVRKYTERLKNDRSNIKKMQI